MDTSPGGSYADRVTLGAVDSRPKVSSVAPRRRSYLSSFEREHFDVLNVMPDRPASAYFTLPDSSVTTKQIFDSLVRDGFPPTSVRCLHNLVPRVLGLFGQRVSARRDSGIIDSIFPENVGSGLITYA